MATSDANIIILPDVISSCPFELECNPHYEVVSKETDAWVSSHGMSHDESVTKYSLFEALIYPRASRRRLRDICDFCVVGFTYDHELDSRSKHDISEQAIKQIFYNMCDSCQPAGSFKPLTIFASVIHEWWQRILVNATPTFQQRFRTTFRDAIEASLHQETYNGDHRTLPDLQTYIKLRRSSAHGPLTYTLLQYSIDFDPPDECMANETLKRLMNCMIDAGAWANDIYSFNNEQSEGSYNLISVLMNANPSLSIQQAMDQVGQMIIDVYADFERLRSQLPSWGADIDDQVKKYVDGLGMVVRGNLCWSFEADRYFGSEREEVKRTRCIKLLPPKTTVQDNILHSQKNAEISSTNHKDKHNVHQINDSQSKTNHNMDNNICENLDDILEPFNYLKSLPGKNVRSKLIEAFNYWFQVPDEKLRVIDEIMGMLHNASLLIDDIEDGSELRRGSPVAHLIYGTPLTINAAELVCFLAIQKAYTLDSPDVGRILIDHLVELHKGQGYDIWWRENNICPTEENYYKMIDNKCGGLFRLTLDLLRICSPINFTEEKTKAINELCQTFGLFFQIRDDYCNLVSTEYTQKKTFCEDLTEGKYSFPIIHAIQNRPNDNRIQNVLKQRTNNMNLKQEVVKLLHEFGSIKYTKDKCMKLADECYALIKKLEDNIHFRIIMNNLTLIFDDSTQNDSMQSKHT
ncbi:unnamed protein product [Adineta steineri]|uniref:Geranylgeranyl pyrophosphate synthase n=1 Tax=Adineta steineri TaxID=433720 RepID=A0A814M1R9_9BILA|nr:unnamed protein product [Adineta steineri]CAF3723630.1 unnamed protein product [Adineta steineri]